MHTAFSILFLAMAPLWAIATELPLPAGGRPMLAAEAKPRAFIKEEHGSSSSLEDATAPAPQVLQVLVKHPPDKPWAVQVTAPLAKALTKGDACVVTFHMRLAPAGSSSERGVLSVNVESRPSYEKTVDMSYVLRPRWQTVCLPFRAAQDIPEGSGVVNIVLGQQAQTVQLAGLQVINYGPHQDTTTLPNEPKPDYDGRAPDAPWRVAAAERIEKYRKSTLSLLVTDPAGKPLPAAKIRVEMLRHAFGFGTAVATKELLATTADGERYRQIVDEHFSRVVFENDMKHDAWTGAPGKPANHEHRQRVMEALGWLRGKDIAVRGHFLVWCYAEPWSTVFYQAKNIPALKAEIHRHMDNVLTATQGRIIEWDGLNHPIAFGESLADVAGSSIHAELLQDARKRTDLPLFINEDLFNKPRQDAYHAVIQDMISRGAAPDGIGNQAHFRPSSLMDVSEWLAMSDRFSALVPNLAVTEYDLETSDDALHADHLRDMLTASFSHPAYSEFILWGFWEKTHWRPEAALWHSDWSARPAAKVWRELVKQQWWTRAEDLSDPQGRLRLQGFHGQYHITVTHGSKTLAVKTTLPPSGRELKLILE